MFPHNTAHISITNFCIEVSMYDYNFLGLAVDFDKIELIIKTFNIIFWIFSSWCIYFYYADVSQVAT